MRKDKGQLIKENNQLSVGLSDFSGVEGGDRLHQVSLRRVVMITVVAETRTGFGFEPGGC